MTPKKVSTGKGIYFIIASQQGCICLLSRQYGHKKHKCDKLIITVPGSKILVLKGFYNLFNDITQHISKFQGKILIFTSVIAFYKFCRI